MAIYEWVAPFSDWIVLIVFCGVGVWTIKEAFEEERYPILEKSIPSFWMLLAIGVFASLDEGAVGLGCPFSRNADHMDNNCSNLNKHYLNIYCSVLK